MLTPGDAVVVGVSGGADSLALLYALRELKEYRLKLIVSHLNHGIRPKEGKRDALFVEGIAKKLDLPFETREVSTPEFKKRSKLSLEEAARTLRYEFLREVLAKHNAQKIATAHTLDDQAETVLMRFIKGSGPLGLSGIPPVSQGQIIRPLIEVPRSEVERYLQGKKVKWVEDSSNREKIFLRNRIRHDLIPVLQKYNPRIKETLAKTANIFRTEEDFIRSRAGNWLEYVFQHRDEDELLGTLSRYKAIPEALRPAFLRIAIEQIKGSLRQVSFTHVASADELLFSESSSGEIVLPGGIVVAKGYDSFLITRKSRLEPKFSYRIASPGKWNFPHAELEIDTVEAESWGEDPFIQFFDRDSVEFPIEIRNYHPGDRFVPLGMKTRKKIKDLFIDEKIPRFLRSRIPIFLSKGQIMWVGGLRMDERFKVRKKKAVRISLVKPRWK
jgi:tRNA(Ile)-lysidine synthase